MIQTCFAIKVMSTLLLSGIATSAVTIVILQVLQNPDPIGSPIDVTIGTGQDNCDCTPHYTYGPLDDKQRATRAEAQFSKDQIRPPNQYARFTGKPTWYNNTNLPVPRNEDIEAVWAKGHLIGSKLGGAGGQEWRNMVPLYIKANFPTMYKSVEEYAADLALAGACIQYLAAPAYVSDNYYPDALAIVVVANKVVRKVVTYRTFLTVDCNRYGSSPTNKAGITYASNRVD